MRVGSWGERAGTGEERLGRGEEKGRQREGKVSVLVGSRRASLCLLLYGLGLVVGLVLVLGHLRKVFDDGGFWLVGPY